MMSLVCSGLRTCSSLLLSLGEQIYSVLDISFPWQPDGTFLVTVSSQKVPIVIIS